MTDSTLSASVAAPEDWGSTLSRALQSFMLAAEDSAALAQQLATESAEALTARTSVGFAADGVWQAVATSAPLRAGTGLQVGSGDPRELVELACSAGADSLSGGGGSNAGPRGLVAELLGFAPHELGSSLCVPIRFGERALGVLLAGRAAAAPPLSPRELRFARHFAERAGVALEHGRALSRAQRELTERRRLAERLDFLTRASSEFSSASADYHNLLELVARTAGSALGELCSIRLTSPDGEWLRGEDASIYHPDASVAAAFRRALSEAPQSLGSGLAGSVAKSGRSVLQPRLSLAQVAEVTSPRFRPLLGIVEVASLMLVPLMSRGRCLGVLTLSRSSRQPPFTQDDLQLAEELADRAALAVENALLLGDLERRLLEIKRGEERFRELVDSAPDAIVLIDQDGSIVLVNAQAEVLFGYTRQELLGQSVESLIPLSLRHQHPPLRARYFAAPRPRHTMGAGGDVRGRRKDGSEFDAEINLSPISTPEGVVITAVIRDVSERKRWEETRARARELEDVNRRVQEASRLKSEFLANMSHELRTPLNAIIGFSSLLHAGKAGPLSETQHEYLGDILTSSRHLLQLINDVLDLSKIEAGRIEVQPQHVDLQRITSEVRDVLRGLLAERKVLLSVEVDADLDDVFTDPRLLKQVLYNYLSNAIKFTAEHGRVELRLEAQPAGSFTVRVKDNGMGVAAADLPRLFREFQQLDTGGAKLYPGTGLGLALTKRIVEAQGGRVGVASVHGEGSTFFAILPRQARRGLEHGG